MLPKLIFKRNEACHPSSWSILLLSLRLIDYDKSESNLIISLASTYVFLRMHCDVFRHGFVESVWRVILSATAGVPVESYRPTHNMNHHVHLGRKLRKHGMGIRPTGPTTTTSTLWKATSIILIILRQFIVYHFKHRIFFQ